MSLGASQSVSHGDLSDPAYEPSDEELKGLMKRAFSDVALARHRANAKLHEEIAAAALELLRTDDLTAA